MCRYASKNYKTHWICFTCEKIVKSQSQAEQKCPHCAGLMLDMGEDFHAPRKKSSSQWKKLFVLTESGTKSRLFASCGCNGPGHQPRTFSEAKASQELKERHPRPLVPRWYPRVSRS